jgi:hypothetical protein
MMELRPRRLIWLRRQRGVDRSIGAVSRVAYSGATPPPKVIATGKARTQRNRLLRRLRTEGQRDSQIPNFRDRLPPQSEIFNSHGPFGTAYVQKGQL